MEVQLIIQHIWKYIHIKQAEFEDIFPRLIF